MKKPNLFIVGAPKCGTTSLSYWLSQHPSVFLADPKEPNYFTFNLVKPYQRTLSEYERLFKNVSGERVICEASTRYLYSGQALKEVIAYNRNAKFIAMVRNPVDMFLSLHNHLYHTGVESKSDPKDAWDAQFAREHNNAFKERNSDPDSLLYGQICLLGEQLELFVRLIPEGQRQIILFDDMLADSSSVYSQVTEFLDIDDTKVSLEARNKSFKARSHIVKTIVRRASMLKSTLGVRGGFGILNSIVQVNRKPAPRSSISNEFRNYLLDYFRRDISKISDITNRDLSNWI